MSGSLHVQAVHQVNIQEWIAEFRWLVRGSEDRMEDATTRQSFHLALIRKLANKLMNACC